MNKITIGLLISILLTSTSVLAQPINSLEKRGLAIAIEEDRRDEGFEDLTADMVMILGNRHGEESKRDLRYKLFEMVNDGDKTLIIFNSPKDIKGMALLSYAHKEDIEDDQWLYLPALRRVKRITSNNKSGPFMGSEFAYEDIVSQEVDKYSYKFIRDEEYDGMACFVIERDPQDLSGYVRQILWIDKAEYRTRKVDYYDRKDVLLKTLTFQNYKQYLDRFWRADEMHMVNHQTGKSTRLIWRNYRFKSGLKERDFDYNSLKRVR